MEGYKFVKDILYKDGKRIGRVTGVGGVRHFRAVSKKVQAKDKVVYVTRHINNDVTIERIEAYIQALNLNTCGERDKLFYDLVSGGEGHV